MRIEIVSVWTADNICDEDYIKEEMERTGVHREQAIKNIVDYLLKEESLTGIAEYSHVATAYEVRVSDAEKEA